MVKPRASVLVTTEPKVATPPPTVLTNVTPAALVVVRTEPKVATPPPTMLTNVTPAALVLVTTEPTAMLLPPDEPCVEPCDAAEDAWDGVPEDAPAPPAPAAALDD